MDLSAFLQGPSARAKEAEALAILTANALPAQRMLGKAKREFGQVLPISELGVFISPTAEGNYRQGKKEATRLLFDSYAAIIFQRIPVAADFIAALDDIADRVRTALGVIDGDEALLCRLAWEKMAWEREQPTWIESAWRMLQALFRRSTPALEPPVGDEPVVTVNAVSVAMPANDPPSGVLADGRPDAVEESSSNEPPGDGSTLDFSSDPGRSKAISAYTQRWTCSEAALARTATVDPADLSKWKKGLLPAESDKKRRIEAALTNNDPPTPAARKSTDP